jgi:hypothetical protein
VERGEVKSREPRQKVLIDARLRDGGGWSDARILNLSSGGLMVRARQAPPRGTYVEICRGAHRIVARVVWAEDDRFGAMAQDRLAVAAFTRGESPDSTAPFAANANDRRAGPRVAAPKDLAERSRRWSRGFEFVAVVALAVAAAAVAFDTVSEALSKPLVLIEARLAAG